MTLYAKVFSTCQTENVMTTSYLSSFELVSALRQQLDAGIDVAMTDSFGQYDDFNWSESYALAQNKQNKAQIEQPAPPSFKQPAQPTQPAAHAVARQKNGILSNTHPDFTTITDLQALRAALEQFDGCALKKTASNMVFADGHQDAEIMIIGEAPGREEDRMGLPFVGAAGQLLDKMLRAVGLSRTDVYITNILPWRPPGNRTPSSEEVELLSPFLMHHIKLKNPRIILALGGSSAKLLLQTNQGIMKIRGKKSILRLEEGLDIPIIPSLHPAYLLRAPAMKKLAFQDLLLLKKLSNG